MLILSRKLNQSFVINNDIVVTIVELGRGHVKVGIEAPQNIPVHRKEVYEAIKSGKNHEKSEKLPKLQKFFEKR